MQKMVFVLTLLSFLLSNCKQETPKTPTPLADDGPKSEKHVLDMKELDGNWIAFDMISRAAMRGSIVEEINDGNVPYALAYTFKEKIPDSVLCFDHFKMWTCGFKIANDSILVITTREGKEIHFQYDQISGRTLTAFDKSPVTGKVRIIRFNRTLEKTVNGYQAFSTAVNHNLFGGGYRMAGSKDPKPTVVFMPTGLVHGLSGYDLFQVCPGGDCLVAGPNLDAMYLMDRKTQKGKWFGFRFSPTLDTLTILNLKNERPKEKAGFTVQNAAYTLVRAGKKK